MTTVKRRLGPRFAATDQSPAAERERIARLAEERAETCIAKAAVAEEPEEVAPWIFAADQLCAFARQVRAMR